MSRIAEKSKRVTNETSYGFDDDKSQVERYGYYIYCRELLNGMMVVMTVVVMVMFM